MTASALFHLAFPTSCTHLPQPGTFYQTLLKHWTRPSPHLTLLLFLCLVGLKCTTGLLCLLYVSQTQSHTIIYVYNGLVKFSLFLWYEQLLANVHSSYSSFPFAFFSIPSFSCFFFSFCNCLSQGNINSFEDIRKFWNNNCKRIIMIPIIMMELIGCIDRFTKKMYHRNGSKNPFICTESLYSTSLLQHWHRFNIVGDLELIAFWHKIHNPCSFQHGVSKVLCGGIWQIPFAEDLKQN